MPTIDLSPYYPVAGTEGDATAFTAAFQALQTLLNGGLDESNLSPDLSFGDTIPAGFVGWYVGASVPDGWSAADGGELSRADEADLFTACGTTYGSGNGTTTFNKPDIAGRVIAGYAASGGHSDVSTLGHNDGTSKSSRRPKHAHTVTDPGHRHGFDEQGSNTPGTDNDWITMANNDGTKNSWASGVISANTTGISVGVSGTTDAPSYIVLNPMVKL